MISKEKVKHIATLARLGLSEEEVKKFQKELSSILDYIEKLKKVDITKVKDLDNLKVKNVTRVDEVKKFEEVEKLTGLMPETKDGYLKVKSVF